MGTVKVTEVVGQAAYMLTDEGNVRWTKQKLLTWFNEAQRALVSRRPDTLAVNESFKCAAGVKQQIPDIGVQLIDIERNTNGKNITQVEKRLLDNHVPDWAAEDQSVTAQHFMFDPRYPKIFYLSPPAKEEIEAAGETPAVPGTELEIVYTKCPDTVAITDEQWNADNTTIEVDDVWANALQEYILHRAWAKDSESAGNQARSNGHFQTFRMMIGDITEADAAITADEK